MMMSISDTVFKMVGNMVASTLKTYHTAKPSNIVYNASHN